MSDNFFFLLRYTTTDSVHTITDVKSSITLLLSAKRSTEQWLAPAPPPHQPTLTFDDSILPFYHFFFKNIKI